MKLGMVGLGRLGSNMVRRLLVADHECVVFDSHPQVPIDLNRVGATATASLVELIAKLETPRAIWMMVPAAVVDATLVELGPLLAADDVVVDAGNSYCHDDIRRAKTLGERGVHYVDVGTSGRVWGFDRGYCQMIGGEPAIVQRLDRIFAALAPGSHDATESSQNDNGTARQGYVHCGPSGAGHFVKMVHNGIEHGIMAAYAEGLNILRHAHAGRPADATPLRNPKLYQYELTLPDIVEAWRHGSVIGSWLLDLIGAALEKRPDLCRFAGPISDSGEGRWTPEAALDESAPAVSGAAQSQRRVSRSEDAFANSVLATLCYQFGAHEEKLA